MKKLITYLKNGKGRGLMAMLIFSAILSFLAWGTYYSTLNQLPIIYPNLASSNLLWIHLGFVLASFIFIWVLYLVIVAVSASLCWILRLQLNKGAVWRITTCATVGFMFLGVLLSLITYVLAMFGQTALQFSPVVITIFIPVLLVMLVAFGLAEPKEGKRKK